MKKEFLQYNHLSDGSRYYENGVWGPSSLDLQRANLSFFNEEPKTKEKPNNDLLFISQESIVARLLQTMSKVKLPAKFAIPGSMATVFLMSACGGVGEKNTQELENKDSSGYTLPFPKGETWFLTGGPHADGLSNGVRYAIDIAPPEGGFCPADGRKFTIDNRVVAASASGEVTTKGDDKNRNDPHHSEIRIKDKNGLTQVYIHLDNTTKVKVGNKVKQGDSLGNPSCEFPPGGANTGPHVHIGLMKDGQAIPIDGAVVGGWTIHENGTMTKPGEQPRTANVGRYGENSTGIRNDLPNGPKKEVLGAAIAPTAKATVSKSVETTKEEWKTFKSSDPPYEAQYPASWKSLSDEVLYAVNGSENEWKAGILRVFSQDIPRDESDLTLESFMSEKEQYERELLDEDYPDAPLSTIKITKHKVSGINAQTILLNPPTSNDDRVSYYTYLITPQADGSRKIWEISYSYSTEQVSSSEAERIYSHFLDSFKLLPSSSVEKKTPVEKKTEVGWTRFKSFDLPFQIDYPSNWQQVGNEFYGETTKANPTKFGVASEPVASWITIDDYKNRFVQSIKDATKLFGGNVQITETPNQSINGQKAWRLDGFVTSSVTTPNRSVTYITIKDGKAWVIVYAADSSEFNQNLPTFEKMLDSFKFLK